MRETPGWRRCETLRSLRKLGPQRGDVAAFCFVAGRRHLRCGKNWSGQLLTVSYDVPLNFVRISNALRRQADNLFCDSLDHRIVGIVEVQNRTQAFKRRHYVRDGFWVE